MKPNPLENYLQFAVETAHQAGRLTMEYYQTGVQANFKADDSPVTIADRKSEELIRSRIEKTFPNHTIIGEEFGLKETVSASHRWIIDPIDGTKSFMRGVPLYAVLLGLEIEGRPSVGVSYFPALDEMLFAATGLGCWWNRRRAHVSALTDLSRAYISTTSPGAIDRYSRRAEYDRLAKACYFQTGWGDAYGYLLVATGRIEIMLDPIMSIWDCAPFPPILSEAGGYFGDWTGDSTIYAGEALATTQTLLPQVLTLLRGRR